MSSITRPRSDSFTAPISHEKRIKSDDTDESSVSSVDNSNDEKLQKMAGAFRTIMEVCLLLL